MYADDTRIANDDIELDINNEISMINKLSLNISGIQCLSLRDTGRTL